MSIHPNVALSERLTIAPSIERDHSARKHHRDETGNSSVGSRGTGSRRASDKQNVSPPKDTQKAARKKKHSHRSRTEGEIDHQSHETSTRSAYASEIVDTPPRIPSPGLVEEDNRPHPSSHWSTYAGGGVVDSPSRMSSPRPVENEYHSNSSSRRPSVANQTVDPASQVSSPQPDELNEEGVRRRLEMLEMLDDDDDDVEYEISTYDSLTPDQQLLWKIRKTTVVQLEYMTHLGRQQSWKGENDFWEGLFSEVGELDVKDTSFSKKICRIRLAALQKARDKLEESVKVRDDRQVGEFLGYLKAEISMIKKGEDIINVFKALYPDVLNAPPHLIGLYRQAEGQRTSTHAVHT